MGYWASSRPNAWPMQRRTSGHVSSTATARYRKTRSSCSAGRASRAINVSASASRVPLFGDCACSRILANQRTAQPQSASTRRALLARCTMTLFARADSFTSAAQNASSSGSRPGPWACMHRTTQSTAVPDSLDRSDNICVSKTLTAWISSGCSGFSRATASARGSTLSVRLCKHSSMLFQLFSDSLTPAYALHLRTASSIHGVKKSQLHEFAA